MSPFFIVKQQSSWVPARCKVLWKGEILIAVAVGLVYDLQNFLQDIPEVRDNQMLLAGVAVFIPMLVALVKDTYILSLDSDSYYSPNSS